MNATVKVPFGVESAASMVRYCQSGDPSRVSFCIISTILGSLSAIVLPIVIAVGTIGNLLVVYVMLRYQRPLTRQNVYLGCIAIGDIFSLIVIGIFNAFLTKGLPWLTGGKVAFISYNLSDSWCKVSRYALNFCHALSCLLLLVLVIDRFLVVHRPLAMKKVGIRWAFRAVTAAALMAAAIALPNGLLTGHQFVTLHDGTTQLYCSHPPEFYLFLMIYTSLMSNPPLVAILVMLVLNGFLVSRVVSATRKRRTLTNSAGEQQGMRDISGTVIVLILAILYLVLHFPVLISRPLTEVFLNILDLADNYDYLLQVTNVYYCSMVFSLINQCITFFVLLRRSDSFRRCVMVLMHCNRAGKAK